MAVDQDLIEAVAALWRIPAVRGDNVLAAPSFVALADLCRERYGGGKATFALHNALQSLGAPLSSHGLSSSAATTPELAAAKLDVAYTSKSTLRRHLCPLDLADDLPTLAFGSARVGQFSADELGALFDAPRLARTFPRHNLDAKRLSQFHWLVVEEKVEIDPRPEARAAPMLFTDFRRDLGEINPHRGRFPPAVERALFFLLLAPWESWSTMLEVDWRGFRVPWIYTLDDDIFVRPAPPPDPESLSLEPLIVEDSWGEEIELERPTAYPLSNEVAEELTQLNESAWRMLEQARAKSLFEAPIEHFFVQAFLSDGIDEILAHITAIEAALGLEGDYISSRRPKPDPHKSLSGMQRVAFRVGGVLNDETAITAYKELFDVRSAFVHGRAEIAKISTPQRVTARSLARRIMESLIAVANRDPRPRELILTELLQQGRNLS